MAGGTSSPPSMRAAFRIVVSGGTSISLPSMITFTILMNKLVQPVMGQKALPQNASDSSLSPDTSHDTQTLP